MTNIIILMIIRVCGPENYWFDKEGFNQEIFQIWFRFEFDGWNVLVIRCMSVCIVLTSLSGSD